MTTPPPHAFRTGRPETDAQIQALVRDLGNTFHQQLLAEMLTATVKLGEDHASTLDLKLLASALKELRYAFKVFQPYRSVRKVAMFGSARTTATQPSYRMAQEFARLLAQSGWMIITGAASGIMRAGQEGAGSEASFGLNIRLPFEQEANPVIAGDEKLVNFKYFFTRKLLFVKESHATVLFPGGFGTLDEGFECLTLAQTGKNAPRPIVMVDVPRGTYWRSLDRFFRRHLTPRMIDPADHAIYDIVTSAAAARDVILDFYSTYHSLRFVQGLLVIRLQRPLPEAAVARLNREFGDVLDRGRITAGDALPAEVEVHDEETLPRLLLAFNRRHFGRLHQLIHRINALGRAPEPPRPARRRR